MNFGHVHPTPSLIPCFVSLEDLFPIGLPPSSMASSRVGLTEFNGLFLLGRRWSKDNLSAAIPLKKMGSPVNKPQIQWLGQDCGHGPSLGPGGSAQQQQQQRAPEWGLYTRSWLASQEYSHFASIHTKEKGLSKFRALILVCQRGVDAPFCYILRGHVSPRAEVTGCSTSYTVLPVFVHTRELLYKWLGAQVPSPQERHRRKTLQCVTMELPATFSMGRGPCSIPSAV